MEWREDLGPARAGDAAAGERLREYLTPFAHGVCLAHAPHHVTEALVPRVLDEAMRSLAGLDDADVGLHVMNLARRLAKGAAAGQLDERPANVPALDDARRALSRLRGLPDQIRERFFLRVVEGIPGPELAEVARLAPAELRAELERGAAEAARAFGQSQSFVGDDYLWELSGAPPPLFARLEMQLPVLRFDPTAAPMPLDAAESAGTFQELKPVGLTGSLGGPMRGLMFDEIENTSVGTEPGVLLAPPPPAAPSHNPFEPQPRTMAATDLPAEARIQAPSVPWAESSSSKSGKQVALPARPVPAVRGTESSGKSGKSTSNKSGRLAPVDGSKSGNHQAMPPRVEVTKDGPQLDEPGLTEVKVPVLALARQADVVTSPESMLGRPTMEMPLGSAIAAPETRINPLPLLAITDSETRVSVLPTAPPPAGVAEAPVFKGTTPLYAAGVLVLVGLIVYSASLFATDRQARANWQLTQVVVAAEDLAVGDVITLENVALRSVPEPYQGSNVVKGDAMNFVLDQKLAVAVQLGDPLFFSQFVSMRTNKGLATRVSKRGRGYTIATNAVAAVGRWVRPGDAVDVLVSLAAAEDTGPRGKPTPGKEPRAVTILQHVRVLATGKSADDLDEATMDPRDREYGDVTLLLTSPEAEVLALAASLGKLRLTLRNEEDAEVDLERGFTNGRTLLDGRRQRVLERKRFELIKFIRTAPAEPSSAPLRRR